MRRVVLLGTVGAALACLAADAKAQGLEWVDSVLPERAFDAGTVARGSKVRHTFKLVNRLDRDVRIVNWRTKCGCTDVRVGAREIPPGTQTTIEAVIDTTKFTGYKPSGLTLILDRPTPVEVDLNLSCFIRSDITLNPGLVDFGIVGRGGAAKPTASVVLNYAGGMPNWGVVKMQTRTKQVAARLQEQDRSAGGTVQYLLTATLDPADLNGFFKDDVTLFTNDPGTPTVAVAVAAQVQSAVTVSPSSLLLGQVKPGQVVKKTLLVRSSQPFKVTGLKPNKDDVTATPDADESRPVHHVDVSFKAPTQGGPFNAVIEIATDLKDEPPAKLSAFANVTP